MAKRKDNRLGEGELLSILRSEERQAVGFYSGEIADDQETAYKYYLGEPFGDEVEGRSQVVSRDVSEVVDWLMPELVRIFHGTDVVVKFEPQGEGDEEQAEHATEYCNWVYNRQNPGFNITFDWFKDALIQKLGVVKVWWEEEEKAERATFEGRPVTDFPMWEQEEGAEVVEHESRPASPDVLATAPEAYLDGLEHDYTVVIKRKEGKIRVAGVPPEEFLISRRAASIEDAAYTCHRSRKTLSDLIEQGFDKAKVMDLPTGGDEDLDEREVVRYEEEDYDTAETERSDRAMREVWVLEEYIRVDYDGDGIAELRKVTRVHDKVLENEEVEDTPWATICPNPMPHKIYGQSVADKIMDLQRIKSVLWRQGLDSTYLANNPQRVIAQDAITDDGETIEQLLTNRAGGLVIAKRADGIREVATPFVADGALAMVQYADTVRESRTGVMQRNQGTMSADVLHDTARGVDRIMDDANSIKELIARVFAETGFTTLFRKMLRLMVTHQDAPRMIRLRDEWVEMDPRQWNADMDVVVSVGLGTGNRDRRAAQMMQLIGFMSQGMEIGIVSPKNLYNAGQQLIQDMGLKSPELYLTDPETQPPQPPQPDPKVAEAQAKIELEQQKAAADIQRKREEAMADLQLEREKSQQEAIARQEEMDREFALKREQMNREFALKRDQIAAELAMKREVNQAEIAMKQTATEVNVGGEPG